MVAVNYRGQQLSIVFKVDAVGRLSKTGIEQVEQTSCALVGPTGGPVAVGNAWRSPQDEANLFLGLEIAFGRALKRLRVTNGLTSAEETRFRETFVKSIGKYKAAEAEKARLGEQDFQRFLEGYLDAEQGAEDTIAPRPVLTEEQQAELNRSRKRLVAFTDEHKKGLSPTPQYECEFCKNIIKEIADLEALGQERDLVAA